MHQAQTGDTDFVHPVKDGHRENMNNVYAGQGVLAEEVPKKNVVNKLELPKKDVVDKLELPKKEDGPKKDKDIEGRGGYYGGGHGYGGAYGAGVGGYGVPGLAVPGVVGTKLVGAAWWSRLWRRRWLWWSQVTEVVQAMAEATSPATAVLQAAIMEATRAVLAATTTDRLVSPRETPTVLGTSKQRPGLVSLVPGHKGGYGQSSYGHSVGGGYGGGLVGGGYHG
ncbi:hypothetical protein MRX96_059140 [Rhipicephalus microplus]